MDNLKYYFSKWYTNQNFRDLPETLECRENQEELVEANKDLSKMNCEIKEELEGERICHKKIAAKCEDLE